MYNGFDWYGRTLEVREVNKLGLYNRLSSSYMFLRTVMLAFLAQVRSVVGSVASVVLVA